MPPNVKFVVDDIEDEWVDEAPYDLIHMRHSCAYLRDVDALLRNCRAGLRPGGWVEFTDFGGYALCDDGTMPGDYAVNECFAMMREVMAAKSGANFLVANEHGENFRRAGFGNVRCRVIKTPIGTWPKVSHLSLPLFTSDELSLPLSVPETLKGFERWKRGEMSQGVSCC